MPRNKQKINFSNHQKILGAKYCYQNAVELLEEADILLKNSRWARAAALAIIGIEEISKIELIGQSFFYKTDKDLESFEKDFKNHNKKLKLADYLFIQSAYQGQDDMKLEEELKDILIGRNLNYGKQRCFYIGYDKDRLRDVPLKLVTKEDALYCKNHLITLVEAYKLIFGKSHNDIVDIIKKMKKYITSEDSRNKRDQMELEIKQKTSSIHSLLISQQKGKK